MFVKKTPGQDEEIVKTRLSSAESLFFQEEVLEGRAKYSEQYYLFPRVTIR